MLPNNHPHLSPCPSLAECELYAGQDLVLGHLQQKETCHPQRNIVQKNIKVHKPKRAMGEKVQESIKAKKPKTAMDEKVARTKPKVSPVRLDGAFGMHTVITDCRLRFRKVSRQRNRKRLWMRKWPRPNLNRCVWMACHCEYCWNMNHLIS